MEWVGEGWDREQERGGAGGCGVQAGVSECGHTLAGNSRRPLQRIEAIKGSALAALKGPAAAWALPVSGRGRGLAGAWPWGGAHLELALDARVAPGAVAVPLRRRVKQARHLAGASRGARAHACA